jgi:purine catabolism regulator
VVGAQVIDVPRAAAWVDRDWLVLTTGVWLRDEPGAAARRLGQLAEAGIAALGFGIEPIYDSVPETLIAAAEEHELPLLRVPEQTPFARITERVFRATLGEDGRAVNRLATMQHHLTEALSKDLPEQTLVDGLAALVEGDVVLLRGDGSTELATGPPPPSEGIALLSRASGPISFESEGRHWAAVPIRSGRNAVHRWLLASVSPDKGSLQWLKGATQAAAPLLFAVDRLEASRHSQERARRRGLLEQLLAGEDDQVLAAQMSELGFDDGDLGCVAVVKLPEPDDAAVRRALRMLEHELEQRSLAFLAAPRGDRLTVLAQADSDDVGATLALLADELPADAIGVSDVAATPEDVPRGAREAEIAARVAARDNGPVQLFGDLGPISVALAELPLEGLRARAEDVLGQLRRYPELLRTLEVYLENDMSVRITAEQLFLHPNSLRYRLSRIEKLVGGSLREPATIAVLFLCLRALDEV